MIHRPLRSLATGLALAGALFAASAVALAGPAAAADSAGTAAVPPLGQPDHIGFLVMDLAATQQQVTAATGAQFQVYTSSVSAQIAGYGTKKVTVTRGISTPGGAGPVLELMQVSDLPEQWRSGRDQPFLSYSVPNVKAYNNPLTNAGMSPIATGDGFAFWQGAGGVVIRLLDNAADPAVLGETAATNNAGAFGPPVALTLYPCDDAAVIRQLGKALGVTWRDPQAYSMPWTLADGSTTLLNSTSTLSQQGSPFLGVESPHGFPGEDSCASDYTPSYLVYATPDVSAAGQRFADAGMRYIGAVPTLTAAYRGTGVSLQAVSPVLIPQ